MHFAEVMSRIDERRTALGISDRQLSIKAGASTSLVRNWRRRLERGDSDVGANAENLMQIAQLLGVSLEWLLTGSGSKAAEQESEGDAIDIRLSRGRLIISAEVDAAGLEKLQAALEAMGPLLRMS